MSKTVQQQPYTTKGYSTAKVFLQTVRNRAARKAMNAYLGTVLRDFFFLQFAVKFGFKKIKIINVDHALDRAVPFTPGKVSIYLDFVAFWIRPLAYIGKRYGMAAQYEYTRRFLSLVDRSYRDAAAVYRFRMTTTRRPKYYKGKFLTIHLFDPHYLCVPSLHIMIVVLAFNFYRVAFDELGMGDEEKNALNKEMYEGAVDIAETVLYIKQHSVNCIPAALYAMTRIMPEEVTPTVVVRFIESLFAKSDLVTTEDAAKIRQHIEHLYEVLYLEGCHDATWIAPLQRWLNAYQAEPE
jgi:hypothetical protein